MVQSLTELLPQLPLIANLRNGLWYYHTWDSTCYFKSTDGHNHNWKFNCSRLNLDAALSASRHGGCIIVDSTRRGKKFPDSMTATIPIWCALINGILFPKWSVERDLALPPFMPSHLKASIQNAIKGIYEDTSEDVKTLIHHSLSNRVQSPLTPIWAGVDEGMIEWFGELSDDFLSKQMGYRADSTVVEAYTPIVLFSCSDDIPEDLHRESHSWHYVKGAGDDEENWSIGLTPSVFWANKDLLLSEINSDLDVHKIVQGITTSPRLSSLPLSGAEHIEVLGTGITLSWSRDSASLDLDYISGFDAIIDMTASSLSVSSGDFYGSSTYLLIGIDSKDEKLYHLRNDLDRILSQALSFYGAIFAKHQTEDSIPRILLLSPRGVFLNHAVLIAILVGFFHKPDLGNWEFANPSSAGYSFRPNRTGLLQTSQLCKRDIKFVSSIAQTLFPRGRLPILPRALSQEIVRFFLSPNSTDMKRFIAIHGQIRCEDAFNSATASLSKKVLSSWDKMLMGDLKIFVVENSDKKEES